MFETVSPIIKVVAPALGPEGAVLEESPEQTTQKRNPKLWVPTLYFTQGFPYTIVTEMSAVFFKDIIKDAAIADPAIGVFQGVFGLPWAFKFIWSPFVEIFSTKRRWILLMQGLLAAMFFVLAAAEFLPQNDTPFSAHFFMPNAGDPLANIGFPLVIVVMLFSLGFAMDRRRTSNVRGISGALALGAVGCLVGFHARLLAPQVLSLPVTVWMLFLVFLGIAILSATHDIAIDGHYMDLLDAGGQAAYSGIRVMFYRIAMVMGGGILVMLAGGGGKSSFATVYGFSLSVPAVFTGWGSAFAIGAVVFLGFFLFHTFYLPHAAAPSADAPKQDKKTFGEAFSTYLDQKRIILILMFILTYRIGDFLWKPMAKPFLMDIGVSVSMIGLLHGTIGIASTIVGSIVGGIFIARKGLTVGLWVLGIIQNVTLLLYAYLAHAFPKAAHLSSAGLAQVACINAFENFAYGLGTIAFVNFLMRTCKKEYTSSHYAIATGLMALAATFASIISGFLKTSIGPTQFFTFCFFASIPGMIILYFLPLKEMEAQK